MLLSGTTDDELLRYALLGLEQTERAIEERITELRRLIGGDATSKLAPRVGPSQVSRKLSPEARQKMAEAQRRRWAAVKGVSGGAGRTASRKKASRNKRPPLSAEARERIAAAMRKRWAALKRAK